MEFSNNLTEEQIFERNDSKKNYQDKVDKILYNVKSTPFALKGVSIKKKLYWLFSAFAFVELALAIGLYGCSFGLSIPVAAVPALVMAAMFHYLLHELLENTTLGWVFKKNQDNAAMGTEVITNTTLSIALLIVAASAVFFLGRKGFSAYRAEKWETDMAAKIAKKDSAGVKTGITDQITADMLTNKQGKITTAKLSAVTKTLESEQDLKKALLVEEKERKKEYDKNTNLVADVVGTSAFAIEILLLFLAYAIATAQRAAAMGKIAKLGTQRQPLAQVSQRQTYNPFSSQNAAQNAVTTDRIVIKGFTRNTEAIAQPSAQPSAQRECVHCSEKFIYKIHNQRFCSEKCRIASWETKTGNKVRRRNVKA